MSYNYNYRVNGTALSPTYATNVRLMEGMAGKRADMIDVAYKHGVYVAARHWTRARLMRLESILAGNSPSTHYTALQGLTNLLMTGTPTLTRSDPVNGDVQSKILVSDPIEQPTGSSRFQWAWPVWQIAGYWEAATASTNQKTGLTTTGTVGPLTIGGNHPVSPKFTITCTAAGSNPSLANAATGDSLTMASSFATSDVIVIDIPNRTVTLNGTRAKNLLTVNRGYWLEFTHGTTPSLTWTATSGTWTVDTEWRNRWR